MERNGKGKRRKTTRLQNIVKKTEEEEGTRIIQSMVVSQLSREYDDVGLVAPPRVSDEKLAIRHGFPKPKSQSKRRLLGGLGSICLTSTVKGRDSLAGEL